VVATLAALREPWLVVAAPSTGGLIVGLILWKVMRTRRAHGIADVIEAGALHNAQISLRTGLTSALVSAISIGSGASVGREGPAVHLGATVAAFLDRQFNLTPAARRVLLASGAAAAVSASFNAPIAGVLFAHEIILGHFALSAFVPTVLAAVVATLITRAWLGDFPAFILSEQHIASYWEFPAFALLGLVCGLVAVCFQLSVMVADWSARRVTLPLWLRPALGGLAVGCMALSVPEVLGVGYEATTLALRESYSLGFLFVLLVAKTAATAICLASRFGGGVFSPSLYIGAMAGGAFGIIAAAAFPEYGSDYGVYALIGMGAVAGAVLGAPISTAVIVFELTGGYELTIAILLSVSIASMVMQGLLGKSFFQWQLSQRGVFLGEGSHLRIVRTWTVRDFLTQLTPDELDTPPPLEDRPKLVPSDTLETALRTFDEGGYYAACGVRQARGRRADRLGRPDQGACHLQQGADRSQRGRAPVAAAGWLTMPVARGYSRGPVRGLALQRGQCRCRKGPVSCVTTSRRNTRAHGSSGWSPSGPAAGTGRTSWA
jgi:CIC family chloride channel protein